MSALLRRRRGLMTVVPPASYPTLETSSGWWVAADLAGNTMPDRIGTNDLLTNNSPVLNTAGTHAFLPLREASSHYLAWFYDLTLDPEAGSFSFVLLFTPRGEIGNTWYLAGSRPSTGNGWSLYSPTSDELGIAADNGPDGRVTTTAAKLVVGTRHVGAALRDGDVLRSVLDGTPSPTTTITGSLTTTDNPRINAPLVGSTMTYGNMDFFGAAWWKGSALTDADTVAAGDELLAASALAA